MPDEPVKPVKVPETPSVIKVVGDIAGQVNYLTKELNRIKDKQIDNDRDIMNLKKRVHELDGRM